MPTFVAFKDGQKHSELVGANPPGLQTLVNKVVSFVGRSERVPEPDHVFHSSLPRTPTTIPHTTLLMHTLFP